MRNVKPMKDKYAEGPGLAVKESKPRYPTIRFDLDTLPEAKDWKVGETYGLEMVVKMVGISQSRFDNSAEFEVRKIGAEDAEEAEDEEKEEGEEGSGKEEGEESGDDHE